MTTNHPCIVLVPVAHHIHPECERSLRDLERRGYMVVRGYGAQIDYLRSQMATDFLAEGYEETLWIDSDMAFSADAVDALRSHQLPICSGLYPHKGRTSLAAKCLPGTESVKFGQGGGLLEIQWAGTGFLHVRKNVYEAVQRHFNLPTCNASTGQPVVPYFLPLIAPIDGEPFYLSEDFSFCERVRQAGFKIFADTSLRLWHIGSYRYGWEDAGRQPQRYDTYTLAARGSS